MIYTAGPPTSGAWYDADVLAQRLDGGSASVLVKGAAQARYAPSGHLVYARAGTLFAVPWTSIPFGSRAAPFRSATTFVRSQARVFRSSRFRPAVHAQPLMREPPRDQVYQPRLSPDGSKLAMVLGRGNDDVWLYDLKQGVLDRLTSGGANHGMPEWSPDGSRVVCWKEGSLYSQPVDRSADATVLIDVFGSPGSWTPDGRTLIYTRQTDETGYDVWALDTESRTKRPVVADPSNERGPCSLETGDGSRTRLTRRADSIYVQTFPEGRFRTRVSRDGGTEPRWGRSERELFFRQGNAMMAVRLESDPPFPMPSRLFTLSSWDTGPSRANYDVAPDGRFVIIRSNEAETAGTQIRVVLNWADQLKRLAPK